MIHICLDELQGLVLDHPDSVRLDHLLEFVDLLSCDTFTVFSGLKGLLKNGLDVSHALNTLSHSEAEVSEPLMVESNSPVLTQEFNDVRNNTLFVS